MGLNALQDGVISSKLPISFGPFPRGEIWLENLQEKKRSENGNDDKIPRECERFNSDIIRVECEDYQFTIVKVMYLSKWETKSLDFTATHRNSDRSHSMGVLRISAKHCAIKDFHILNMMFIL